jgi:hypothetical protein
MLKILNRIVRKMNFINLLSRKNHDAQNDPQFPVPERCPVCGASSFTKNSVLWDSLVRDWQLTPQQRSYVDLQQGLVCENCKSNLRSMTLASAILFRLRTKGTFAHCCASDKTLRNMRVLEINEAGSLTTYLRQLPKHLLAAYPEYDMQKLALPDSSFDLVIHSDTLEHVPDSIRSLQECKRVLAPGGFLAYTIPIIPDRLTRSRDTLSPSYHGRGDNMDDCLVHREYGCDFWCELFEANFRNIYIHCIIYPASMAVIGEI